MKTCVFVFLLMVCSLDLQATPVLVGNPYTPYPPGCATLPELQAALYGDHKVKVFDGQIGLYNGQVPRIKRNVNLAVYRVACAEPNRSIIWLEFSIPEGVNPYTAYEQPYCWVELTDYPGLSFGMDLLREPNIWGLAYADGYRSQPIGNLEGTMPSDLQTRWTFVLDTPDTMLSSEYNAGLKLNCSSPDIDIPATESVLSVLPDIPLNGRLSGNWVMEGIPDQGLLISVSELADDQSGSEASDPLDFRLLMFLSWYTYDANGELLWLTGAAEFAPGATEVAVPIELVTHGEFFGSKTADREVVGSVTISGNNCNDLGFQYDLEDIGLGSGTQRLQRLFSLETAGYPCRDLEARVLEKGK